MQASTLDLRRRTAEIIAALERGEAVKLSYRGHETAVIQPLSRQDKSIRVQDHPLFGANQSEEPVEQCMHRLRAARYDAV